MTPDIRITDPNFVWVPSAQTDVTRTWRKHGWVPPSEQKEANHAATTADAGAAAGDRAGRP